MRRETPAEREAWTAHVEGGAVAKPNKYGAVRVGKYPSKKEAAVAADLAALERTGHIRNLREQVKFVLVPGNGRIRPICYIADFCYDDLDGVSHVIDVKGFSKNQVWRIKQKLMALLHGLNVEVL